MSYRSIFVNGLVHNNQATVALLGLCPLLAVSNTTINSLAMGIATMLVLLVSNSLVSLFRQHIGQAIRIPIFVIIIAAAVSIIEMVLAAWFPNLYDSLGIFVALIVTNCLILARADAFAYRHPFKYSVVDALGMGSGFLIVLVIIGMLRELFGLGTLLVNAHHLFGTVATDWTVQLTDFKLLLALMPPGAFFVLGLLIAVQKKLTNTRLNNPLKQQNKPAPPTENLTENLATSSTPQQSSQTSIRPINRINQQQQSNRSR